MTHPDNELYWAQQVRNAIQVGRHVLCVFSLNNSDLFESYEVAEMLGYKQHSSLRKQTLTDWKDILDEGTDYVIVRDPEVLQLYDGLVARARALQLKPVHPTRGRLFFTLKGLVKILRKTSKPTTELEAALRNKYDGIDWNPDVTRARPLSVRTVSPPPPPPAVAATEDRKFEYEVLQKLIDQLERIKAPNLRSLAITAAESALGRRLDDVRTGEVLNGVFGATATRQQPPQATLHPAPPVQAPKISGPIFTENDFFSMTRIGEKAGGYSARQAGLAADIVAGKMGYSREQIRNEQLPINQLAMRPDTTTGKKRQMVRFHTKFANRVIHELRSNPNFEPEISKGIPTLTPFDKGEKPYPKLSLGPLDDQPT